ncbi:hypothetical protein [Streptomyces cucumeris]|uniref:hypothetical protein n=1 Tax=Streptomyces cucumeris TaxID=2962890 RepID=UPI0020C93096|nr:hypothetical protein [Streptomyces sp. NEAU-Y11]MCP9212131.1 hypothetical protein [Streptomyces sp. NEAU-Y11]
MSNQPHDPQHPQNPYEPHGPYGSPETPYGGQQPPADPYGSWDQGGYDQGYGQAGQQPQQGQEYGGHAPHPGYGTPDQHPQQGHGQAAHQPQQGQEYGGQHPGHPGQYTQPAPGRQAQHAPHPGYAPQQAYGQPDPYAQAYPAQNPYAAAPQGHQQQGHAQSQGHAPQGHQQPQSPPQQQGHPQQPYSPGWDQQHQPQPAAAFAAHGPQGPAPVTAAPTAMADPAGPEHPSATAPAAPEETSRPLTAAEKARAEGRPQILHPGLVPAALTSVIAAALAGAAPLGRPAVAVVVALLQAVTAAGWFRLNGMWPARQGIALAFAGGLAATAGLLATERTHAPTVVIGTLGVWLLLVLVLQLRSHSSPDERLYGLTATVASTALAVIAAGYLATAAESTDAVVIGAAGVAGAVLVRAVPLPIAASVVVALLAAAGAGAGAGQLTGTGTTDAALLGLAAGACALIGHRVASYDYPSRFVHMTAGVALPLAAAAPVVYVIGRALI